MQSDGVPVEGTIPMQWWSHWSDGVSIKGYIPMQSWRDGVPDEGNIPIEGNIPMQL